jgi:hypothetical protein
MDLKTDLLGIFTPGEVNTISGVFKRMEIAEQEIAAAQERHPQKADLLWECFAMCKPPDLLNDKSDVMYRAHCRELLERVAAGENVAEPTNAELMAAFSVVSLATPLTDAATFASEVTSLRAEAAARRQTQELGQGQVEQPETTY